MKRRNSASFVRAALTCALLAVSAGCARNSEPVVSATLADAPTNGVREAEITVGPLVQPADVDLAFAQAVLDRIDASFTRAVQRLAQTRALDDEFMAYLNALNTNSWVGLATTEWLVQKDELIAVPGPSVTTAERIVEWSPGCIVVAVHADYTAWFPPFAEDPRQRYIALVARQDPGDRLELNNSGWQLNYDGWQEDGGEPEDACDARP
jgi:hypothetical protein